MRIMIYSMIPDKQEFADHSFVTIMFDQLLKSSCEEFLTNIEQSKSDWMKKPKKFYCTSAIIDFKNMYKNYNYTGNWDKANSNAATINALVTTPKKERDKNSSKAPKNPGAPGDERPGLEIWNFRMLGSSIMLMASSTFYVQSMAARMMKETVEYICPSRMTIPNV